MKTQRIFATLILILSCVWVAFAQEGMSIAGEITKLDTDLEARRHPVIDINERTCALIKVSTTADGLRFDTGSLGIERIEQKREKSEWWLYVQPGTEKLKVTHPQYGQLNTPDGYYHFAPLQAATVYRLELRTPQADALEQINQDGYLIFDTAPSGAQVYLARYGIEEYVGTTPVQKKLHYGTYRYRIEMPGYQKLEGVINIDRNIVHERQKLNPQMFATQDDTSFGVLEIITTPYYAEVSIEGQNVGLTPLSYNLPVGEYDVMLSKQGYETVSRHVAIVENGEENIIVELLPANAGASAGNNVAKVVEKQPEQKLPEQKQPEPQQQNPSNDKQLAEERVEDIEVVHNDVYRNIKKSNINVPVESVASLPMEVQELLKNMVFVEGGEFWMGAQSEDPDKRNYDESAEEDEAPVHRVTLSDYYIGKYEVTQALWTAVMGTTLEMEKIKAGMVHEGNAGVGDDYPMYYVGNGDAKVFCSKLSALTGKKFRLPTEAEWEYAARGGNKSRGYKFSGSNKFHNIANLPKVSDNEQFIFNLVTGIYQAPKGVQLNKVGKKLPNELGLYDMSGNVWEWCSDIFGGYPVQPQTNPKGLSPEKGEYHIVRGGSCFYPSHFGRVTYREGAVAGTKNSNVGFRVVCEP